MISRCFDKQITSALNKAVIIVFGYLPRHCSYNCSVWTHYSWFRWFLVENQTFLERHQWDASANVNEWHFEQSIMSLCLSFQIYSRHHNDFNCATCTAHDIAVPFKKVTMVTIARMPVRMKNCVKITYLQVTILAKAKVILWMMFWRTAGECSKV